jgi:hypothetical protein
MTFGLGAIDETFILPGILGDRDDIGKWVGCDGQRIMGKSTTSGPHGFALKVGL